MIKINFNQIQYFIIISFCLILFSNQYYSFNETLIYGGSDGYYYMKISQFAPSFGEDIQYIKGERFIIPYVIGLMSKIIGIDIFLFYRITSIIFCFVFILLFFKILSLLKFENNLKIICLSLVIFNPYILRFFIAIPTILLDLFFFIFF